MDFKCITDTLNGNSLSSQSSKHNITLSSMTYRIQSAVKNFKKLKAIRSNKELYAKIKFDKSYRDIRKNKDNWNEAMGFLSSNVPVSDLSPVVTIFKADNINEAFSIATKQESTLSAYEGALLMYNTLVSNYKVNK